MPRRVRDSRGLSSTEAKFISEYLRTLDPKASAKAAGVGYEDPQILRRPHVRAAIQEALSEEVENMMFGAPMVLRTLYNRAFYDPRKLIAKSGEPISLHDLDDANALLIDVEIRDRFVELNGELVKVRETTLKTPNREQSIDKLTKVLRLIQQTREGSMPQSIQITLQPIEAQL